MRVRAEAKGLPLEIENDTPIPEKTFTDPIRLRKILINLIANAVRFTGVGYVRLAIRSEGHENDEPTLQFEVNDSGSGIAQDQIGNLFKPFSQAEKSSQHTRCKANGRDALRQAVMITPRSQSKRKNCSRDPKAHGQQGWSIVTGDLRQLIHRCDKDALADRVVAEPRFR